MLKRVLKALGIAALVLVVVAGVAWLFRSDPIMMISGRTLSGEEIPYPENWDFTNDHFTIAVETRPEDPHSVTTVCFVHEGALYVPAQSGSSKRWPAYVLADPRVRIKVDGKIYPAKAERVLPLDLLDYRESLVAKFPMMADRKPEDLPPDIWLFRIGPRDG